MVRNIKATFLGLVGFAFTRMAALNRASWRFSCHKDGDGDDNGTDNDVSNDFLLGPMGLLFSRVITL